jgi:C1A family cysteine protease
MSESERIHLQDIPAFIDWRNNTGKSYVNPVKDQGQCGSCWAFSAVGAMESRYAIANSGSLPSLSEQQLVDCANGVEWVSEGCNGGWSNLAIAYAEKYGMMNEASYPYVASNQNCSYNESEVIVANTTFANYTNVTVNSSAALKAAIA